MQLSSRTAATLDLPSGTRSRNLTPRGNHLPRGTGNNPPLMAKRPTLFIIDGSNNLYRSYYAIRNLTNSSGFATNAVYGFVGTLRKLLKDFARSEEHTSELQSPCNLVCRLLLEKKNIILNTFILIFNETL